MGLFGMATVGPLGEAGELELGPVAELAGFAAGLGLAPGRALGARAVGVDGVTGAVGLGGIDGLARPGVAGFGAIGEGCGPVASGFGRFGAEPIGLGPVGCGPAGFGAVGFTPTGTGPAGEADVAAELGAGCAGGGVGAAGVTGGRVMAGEIGGLAGIGEGPPKVCARFCGLLFAEELSISLLYQILAKFGWGFDNDVVVVVENF